MITKYYIRYWDKKSKKYRWSQSFNNIMFAEKIYNKPYSRKHTRQLVKVTEEVLYKDRGNK